MKILIVEDDPLLRKDLTESLNFSGFSVDEAEDGETAWFMGETGDYDGIILDLGLPVKDGLTVLKLWRKAGVKVPIIILSARGNWMERVEGIDSGADDYLAKPFEMLELISRLRALIRRSAGIVDPVIHIGELTIDSSIMRVRLDHREISLTALEYRLLYYLAINSSRVVPSTEIAEHIYDDADSRDSNALEALIGRLRKKIGADMIETRRGLGYRLKQDRT